MSFIVVIPARFASSRLPGKPLLRLAGKPILQRVCEVARRAGAGQIIVATDDERIAAAASAFCSDVVMTSAEHMSGTSRVAEVVAGLGLSGDDLVINLQGDEPLMSPDAIGQLAHHMLVQKASYGSLFVPIQDRAQYLNPNVVKVLLNADHHAIYFSRSPLPWSDSHDGWKQARRHIGIYGYTVAALQRWMKLPLTALEQLERLEQLRLIAHGEKMLMVECSEVLGPGIDTAADLEEAEAWLAARI